jgi:DNA-binding transcriptional MerR regulator
MFTPDDIKNLKIIHRLLKEEGMTMQGAKKKLTGRWEETEYKYEITNSLQKIKELLIDLRDNI